LVLDKMFDFLKRNRTSSLEHQLEKQAYQKQKLLQAEETGKDRAKAEAKQAKKEIAQAKPVKSAFGSFLDYAGNFADSQKWI